MKNNNEPTEANIKYAAAYTVHYEEKNLREAFERYRHIVTVYKDTQEARYAQTQIHNIINNLVPQKDIFDAQVNLLLSHLHKHEHSSHMKADKN